MADLAVWQRTIVDEKGNIIPGAEVEVRSYPGGSLITLYRGPDGEQIKSNPFRTGEDGFARFWAESQRAEIIAHGAGSTIRWIVDLINADEVIGDAVTEATAAAAVAVSEAEAAADRAEAARDAAQLNAHIYPTTAAGLAATSDGDYFSVPSESDDEYLILYRNDSGSATEVSRTLSHGFEDNWLRIQPGIYFHDFDCEVDGEHLYFLPLEYPTGGVVFLRGGYLGSDERFSYDDLLADLASQDPPPDAHPNRGVEVGVTSPSGWENCLRFYGTAALWYNPMEGRFRAGNRNDSRRGDIMLVHWNRSDPGWCVEEPRLREKLAARTPLVGWAQIFTPHFEASPGRIFPNYSRSAKTLTLYEDTILKCEEKTYVLPEDEVVEIGSSRTANSVYWMLTDDAIVTRRWDQSRPPNSILIASVRDSPNAETAVLSMPCPYTVDGILFGAPTLDVHEPNPVNAFIRGIHHRGYNLVAPEETLPAYIASARARNYCVEGDIRWTSDDIPVLLHDATIDRTSDGTGNIAEMTLAEARAFDFGGWKGPEFAGTPIPTFEEALRLCKKLSLFAYWEIKAEIDADKAQEILRLIRLTGMTGHVELDSFRQSDLQLIVAEAPTQQVGRLGNMSSQLIADCVSLQTGENKVFAAVRHTTVTPELVEEARDNGIGVVVWTVNNPAVVLDMAALGVDGIMTDGLNIAEILRDSELS